jgi:hypothetical protein
MAPEEGDFTDQPPQRRREDNEPDDQGYSEQPPRRHRPNDREDDDEITARIIRRRRSWLDQQFADTSIVLLVLFPMCCGLVALVFGIVGVAACQEPKARRNALIVLIISVAWIAIAFVVQVVNLLFR